MRGLVGALIFAAIAICVPSAASAQNTTCIGMGPNMVSCNTTPSYQDDPGKGFRELGQAIANIRENNFRKKLGKLLASGDCEGAARLALEKGRLEVGSVIRESCRPSPKQQEPAEVSRQLQAIAAQAKTPEPYGEGLTVTAVQAAGMQLIVTMRNDRGGPLPIEQRYAAIRDVCSSEPMRPLLLAGAIVRAIYLAPDGAQSAKDEVTASVCGLR